MKPSWGILSTTRRSTIGALAGVNCMPLGFDSVMIRPRAESRSPGRDTVISRMPPCATVTVDPSALRVPGILAVLFLEGQARRGVVPAQVHEIGANDARRREARPQAHVAALERLHVFVRIPAVALRRDARSRRGRRVERFRRLDGGAGRDARARAFGRVFGVVVAGALRAFE